MGVSGGSKVFRWFSGRLPLARSTSSGDGKGVVRFASTDEVLTLVYRPNLSVRDVCTEAAIKGKISPVALDFFTLVTEDGNCYLNPNKVLSETECNQTYLFKLCMKACHGEELRDIDREAFEYYFHQCRKEFLSGKVGEFGQNHNDYAKVVIYEIVYCAKQKNVPAKYVIENPNSYGILRLFKRGIFKDYGRKDIKTYLQSEKVQMDKYEKLGVEVVKSEYIRTLERAEDFFVHKLLSFEKIYLIENQISNRKFEVQVSAEFGIKKRRTDTEKSLPEDIVKEFSEVEALEFDPMKNQLTIIRENSKPEILTASSPQVAHSLITLIEGYYCLMINQYKRLLRGPKRAENVLYHGPILREKAENLLQKGSREDGTFLLRKRRSVHSSYVLSLFHSKEVKHYIINQNTSVQPPIFHLESDQTKGFSTLQGLIEHYKQSPHGLPVCLTTIYPPNTEGLAALLDRELLTPAPPEFQLVDDSVRISLDDLSIELRALSQEAVKGEFGEVRKGSWWCSSAGGLMPIVSRAMVKPTGREKLIEYRKAMSTFLELKNQHLILCHGIAEYKKSLLFVFEFASEGPLDDYIRKESGKKSAITKGRVVSYAAQIAEGMMFLHSKECVHGRLSAHNVLMVSENCAKISDSGLLDLVKTKQSFYASGKGNGFSYCWFSPESLQSHSFNKKSDVWSFGVTLWEMFVMKKPFHCNLVDRILTREEILRRYLKGQYLDPDRPNVPVKVQALIKRCCSADPQARRDFQELVVTLRSPELVPEKEAEEVLLLPGINELEDWETPVLPRENELKLLKHRAGSEASNADYSCLPGHSLYDDSGSCNDNVKLPGFTYMPNSTIFNNTILRKESLSKTFSHPGLVSNDNLPLRNPVNALSMRKVSITRASSCPPAIEATTDETPQPYEVRAIESGKTQREVTFIQPPTSSSRGSTDGKLPFAPQLAQLEMELLDNRSGSSVDGSVKQIGDTGGDTSSTEDDYEQHTTEAMAMQCLGGLVKGTVILPPSYAEDVLNGTHESNMADSNDQLSELSGNLTARHMGGCEIPPSDSVCEEINAQLCERDAAMFNSSFSENNEVALLADNLRKLRSGSYVTLSMLSQSSLPSKAEEHPSEVPSAADDALALDGSAYRTLGTTEVTKASSSFSASSSLHGVECSSNEGDTELNHSSPGFHHCTSSDALLGSFSNLHPPNGVQAMGLTQFLRDTDSSSVREESSPVITDLQDSSENEDASSREDAESSLGNIFHSGFNRMAKDNNGEGALDLYLHSFTHLGFGIDPPEQQEVVLENDSPSHPTTPLHAELDKSTLFMGVADRENLVKDDHESGKYLPEENQATSCMPCFDELFSTIEPDNSTSTLPTNECDTSVLDHTSGALDDDEQSEARDNVGDRFEKIDFLNLKFDHGLENFEMKEFPLNNLSKAQESKELLFFKDNQSVCQGMGANQLDDTLSEGGFSQDNEQEGDEVIEENLLPVSSPYSIKADLDGRLQEITSTTPEVPSEPQPRNRILVTRGYQPPPPPAKQEQETSLNWSSSDGYWPNGETVDGLVRKKSATGSSLTGTETSTVQLDMNKIPSRLKIPFEHLQILDRLGHGQFGEVRRARMVYTDNWKNPKREDVAVKVLKANASQQSSSDFVKEVENMVELACKPQCQYIIKLRGVCIGSEDKLMLVTELASQGALRDYLPKNKDILGKSQLLEFCKQICEGMEYLEKHSLLHRDLAARNILVMSEDVVKISDFGLSRLQDYYKLQNLEDRLLPLKWYALESLLEKRFTTKSDVWSFGVTMWEIFSYGGDPYHDIKSEELYNFLESGNRLSCPEKCPRDVYQVMQKCWIKDPTDRPTFYYLNTEHLAKCSVDQ